MDDVECLGNETELVNCPFDGWAEHNCDRSEGAGVFCNDSKFLSTAKDTNAHEDPDQDEHLLSLISLRCPPEKGLGP